MTFRLPLTALCAALLLAGCVSSEGLHTQGRAVDPATHKGDAT